MRISQRVAVVCAALTAALASGSAAQAVVSSSVDHGSPQFNGSVYAIAYHGNTVYVGGSFTSAVINGHRIARERLAAFDTRSGALLDWDPRADATVRALATSDDAVYAAGDFAKISGRRRDSLARIDGRTGAIAPFSHRIGGTPRSLTVGDGKLYVGGSISSVDGRTRAHLAAFSLYDGILESSWTPTTDDTVNAVVFHDDKVYLGGSFHRTDGERSVLRLAAVSAADGSLDRGFRPAPPAVVYGVAVDDNRVYAAMGGQGGRATAYTKTGQTRWSRVFDGDAQAIAVLDGTAYVGGHFDTACTTAFNGRRGDCSDGSRSRVKLAAVSPSGKLSNWAPQANGIVGVRTIVVDPVRQTLAVGGDFTTIGGKAQKRTAFFG